MKEDNTARGVVTVVAWVLLALSLAFFALACWFRYATLHSLDCMGKPGNVGFRTGILMQVSIAYAVPALPTLLCLTVWRRSLIGAVVGLLAACVAIAVALMGLFYVALSMTC